MKTQRCLSFRSFVCTCSLAAAVFFPLSAQTQTQPSAMKIAVITHKNEGFRNGFWDALQAGARRAASERKIELEYRGIDPSYSDNRVEGQTALFEEYTARGFNAIVFTPADRIRMSAPVKKAVSAGLKVVAIDSEINSPLLSGIFATNNFEGGRQAARTLAQAIGNTGDVLLLAHPTRDNKATRDRELAFAAELRNNYPKITLVSADRFGGATVETDAVVARELLDTYPAVKGVYTISGSGLEAFMNVLDERKLSGKIKLVGWDSGPAVLDGLRRGTVTAIMQQNPHQMAYLGVKAAADALSGKESRQIVDTGTVVIMRNNLDSPAVNALLNPDNSNWIK